MPIIVQVIDVNKYLSSPSAWAPQARGPLCFAHAAQSIATPLFKHITNFVVPGTYPATFFGCEARNFFGGQRTIFFWGAGGGGQLHASLGV